MAYDFQFIGGEALLKMVKSMFVNGVSSLLPWFAVLDPNIVGRYFSNVLTIFTLKFTLLNPSWKEQSLKVMCI